MFVEPSEAFEGTVLVMAPHMDDEVLACGGTIALLPDKERVHVVYATDGAKSPAPPIGRLRRDTAELRRRRVEESVAALGILGVPPRNLHFLGLPEGRQLERDGQLGAAFARLLAELRPGHVLTPFRYDRHPDHLAVTRATRRALRQVGHRAEVSEYFVYYRWRLLPGGDVRRFVRPEHLVRVPIERVAPLKRSALDCFTTQTTRFYPWQERPILTRASLEQACGGPEVFVRAPGDGQRLFTGWTWWIRFAHSMETPLKRRKDRLLALLYLVRHHHDIIDAA